MSEMNEMAIQTEDNIDPGLAVGTIQTPKQFEQLGVLVIDGSGSMTQQATGNVSKAQATNAATRELFTRFKASRVAKNFSFGVVSFDQAAKTRLQPTPVGPSLDDNGDYNPLNGHGGGTCIYAALEEAENIVNDFLGQAPPEGVPHSVVILVMSDGGCSNPVKTREVADRIKNGPNGASVTICSTLFGTIGSPDSAGEALLKEIASDPVMGYKTVYDGETLRNFFERSISAASGGIQIA